MIDKQQQIDQLQSQVDTLTVTREKLLADKDIIEESLKAVIDENNKLKRYKSLFEKTRNLWNEARINNYKLLDEIKDLKDSLKRTICQSECYRYKEAENLKQTLIKVKNMIEKSRDKLYDCDSIIYADDKLVEILDVINEVLPHDN